MEIFGYLLSIFIGITLGVFGSGGSVLAVPILVYLFKIEPIIATLYSLFIVGSTTFIGAINYFKNKLIDFKIVLLFGIPSLIFVIISRKIILPAVPETLFTIGNFVFTKNIATMLLFALLMLGSARNMIKKRIESKNSDFQLDNSNYFFLFLQGSFIGLLTGLVGAGGGFLIIPALVLLMKLPIKKAVGTSLVIITLNSLIGFLSEVGSFPIEWYFLAKFLLFSIIGIFIGISISNKIDNDKLKPYFGYFILIIGIFIIVKEVVL